MGRGGVSALRRCRNLCRTIAECSEGGCSVAGECHLSAGHGGAAKRRSGFGSGGFRKSCAARAEESRGAQLAGLGPARAGRDRCRGRSFSIRGETESQFFPCSFVTFP